MAQNVKTIKGRVLTSASNTPIEGAMVSVEGVKGYSTLTDENGCYVLDTLKTLIAQEREVLRLAADAGDEVTVALMSDYLKEQEKTVWMLVAFNSPKCAK